MQQLLNPALIKVKGVLFLFLGLMSAGLLLLDQPSLKIGLLLAIAVWSFCRFYYFAFYVIEHYVDKSFRYSGLFAFFAYLFKTKKTGTEACPFENSVE